MRFFATASALLAMATAAIAQEQTADFNPVYSPETDENVVAGSTFEITWEAPEKYAAGTVSIHLIGGATQGTQIPIADIASKSCHSLLRVCAAAPDHGMAC
jgi:phage tail sheath gpL-like